jgi:hypothetical protein
MRCTSVPPPIPFSDQSAKIVLHAALEQKNHVYHPPDEVASKSEKLQYAQTSSAHVETVDAENAQQNGQKQRGAPVLIAEATLLAKRIDPICTLSLHRQDKETEVTYAGGDGADEGAATPQIVQNLTPRAISFPQPTQYIAAPD